MELIIDRLTKQYKNKIEKKGVWFGIAEPGLLLGKDYQVILNAALLERF